MKWLGLEPKFRLGRVYGATTRRSRLGLGLRHAREARWRLATVPPRYFDQRAPNRGRKREAALAARVSGSPRRSTSTGGCRGSTGCRPSSSTSGSASWPGWREPPERIDGMRVEGAIGPIGAAGRKSLRPPVRP
jgi:hypothetical protein